MGSNWKCAEMSGGPKLDMTVEYATELNLVAYRSFQAIQHHCANMAVDVEGSSLLLISSMETF